MMISDEVTGKANKDGKSLCPSCGKRGQAVKGITIKSLVVDSARKGVGQTDGFRFCAEPSCEVAYFHPESGDRFLCSDVKVRIGQKETAPPRMVCYCFSHTAEEIEEEIRKIGASYVADEIAEKCREGLDRCQETNPQGTCCLGNVRHVIKMAEAKLGGPTPGGGREICNETLDCKKGGVYHDCQEEC